MSNCSSFFNMFYNCKALVDLDVSKWDTKNGINMQSIFNGCESLISINLENWTSPRAIVMNGMFSNCLNLQEVKNLTKLNTELVSLLNSMFSKCAYITDLDLSSFDASIVTNLDYIFQGCTRLINLSAMRNIKSDISVKDCPNITADSILSIINNLVDVPAIEEWILSLPLEEQSEFSLPVTRTLELGAINLAKLTPEQIKIATDKGWSVA